jgi:hypothetical protein
MKNKLAIPGLREALSAALPQPAVPQDLPTEWRHRANYLKAQAQLVQRQHIEAERMADHQYSSGFLCFEARELLAQANTLELCAMEMETATRRRP